MPVRQMSATTLPAVFGTLRERALVAMRGPVPGLPIIRHAVAGLSCTSEEAEREPFVVAEAVDTENPPVQLHSEAVRRMLSVVRDLKTEMWSNA
jgi:hypothetical protein